MKHLLAAAIMAIGFCTQAQDTTRIKGITAGWPGIEFFYEIPWKRSTSLLLAGGIAPGNLGALGLIARPMVSAETRWYYTLNRRNRIGKNTNYHSANYLSLDATYVSPLDLLNNLHGQQGIILAPKFGVRRNPFAGFLIEWDFGYGLWYDGKVTPGIDFSLKLGYAF